MTWLATIAAVAAVAVILLDVEPLWIQMVVFAIALAFFLMALLKQLPAPQVMKDWLSRRAKFIIFVLVLAAVNLVARHYEHVFDFSKSKLYALQPKTIEQLQVLGSPVRILIFLRTDDKTVAYAEWLQQQMNRYTQHVDVEIKNINRDILLARQYDVTNTGEAVLLSGNHWVKVGNFQEHVLIPGLIRLVSKSASNLCFVAGHGEPDLADPGPTGLGAMKTFLGDLGYRLQTVSLLESDAATLRQQCHALFLFSPRTALLDTEVKRLQELKEAKLPFLVAIDPPTASGVLGTLKEWGIKISDEVLVDEENLRHRVPITDIIIPHYFPHRLTQALSNKLYFPQTRTIDANGPETWTSVLQTPASAQYHLLEDKGGQAIAHTVGLASAEAAPNRQLVLGSGRGFLGQHLPYGDNQQFLLNAVHWLLDEKEVAWTTFRETAERYMEFTPAELGVVRSMAFYGLPGLIFFLCSVAWLRRRWHK